ncbi:hypothetical protein J7S33_23415 [Saccharothrix algeriensis]|uniref:Uncharacterized protein n=1 Tax=Saccharothrix algeriensis TaxID=173560 RepID=A0A8T8HUS3_9PSEU|nr:hypothetical protein J7S33_23415 [Saccharothrix algeriensis]
MSGPHGHSASFVLVVVGVVATGGGGGGGSSVCGGGASARVVVVVGGGGHVVVAARDAETGSVVAEPVAEAVVLDAVDDHVVIQVEAGGSASFPSSMPST